MSEVEENVSSPSSCHSLMVEMSVVSMAVPVFSAVSASRVSALYRLESSVSK